MRKRTGRTTSAVLAVAAAVLFGACGGSDDNGAEGVGDGTVAADETTAPKAADGGAGSSGGGEGQGPSDEEKVRVAIEALLVDPDNDFVCNEVLSENLLATAYGDLQGCLNGRAPETLAESVRSIRKLEIDGDRATAVVVAKGGLYDGVPLDVEAVRDGEAWRIDEFIADVPVGP